MLKPRQMQLASGNLVSLPLVLSSCGTDKAMQSLNLRDSMRQHLLRKFDMTCLKPTAGRDAATCTRMSKGYINLEHDSWSRTSVPLELVLPDTLEVQCLVV